MTQTEVFLKRISELESGTTTCISQTVAQFSSSGVVALPDFGDATFAILVVEAGAVTNLSRVGRYREDGNGQIASVQAGVPFADGAVILLNGRQRLQSFRYVGLEVAISKMHILFYKQDVTP